MNFLVVIVAAYLAMGVLPASAENRLYSGFWGGFAENPIGIEIDEDGNFVGAFKPDGSFLAVKLEPNEFGGFETIYEGWKLLFTPAHGGFYIAESFRNGEGVGLAVLRENAPDNPESTERRVFTGRWNESCRISIELNEVGDLALIDTCGGKRRFAGGYPRDEDWYRFTYNSATRNNAQRTTLTMIEKFFVAFHSDIRGGNVIPGGVAVLEPKE